MRDGDEMSGRLGRHVIGRYGVGTLWCVREADAFFIFVEGRGLGTAGKGMEGHPCGPAEIRVQHNNSERVIVSLNSSTAK
jgi:hypothetical protein